MKYILKMMKWNHPINLSLIFLIFKTNQNKLDCVLLLWLPLRWGDDDLGDDLGVDDLWDEWDEFLLRGVVLLYIIYKIVNNKKEEKKEEKILIKIYSLSFILKNLLLFGCLGDEGGRGDG